MAEPPAITKPPPTPEVPPPAPKPVDTQLPNEHISAAPQALQATPPRPHAESDESRLHVPSTEQHPSHVDEEQTGVVMPQEASQTPPTANTRT
jgi:hypothetical protein